MLNLLGTLVPWVLVPLILIALLVFSLKIVARAKKPELKSSARAGFWAGLVLLTVFIISQLQTLQLPKDDFGVEVSFNPFALLAGFILGFILLWLVRLSLRTRLVGLTTILLSAASTIALYSFIFIEGFRTTILYLSLGLAFGVFFHVVIFPATLRKI